MVVLRAVDPSQLEAIELGIGIRGQEIWVDRRTMAALKAMGATTSADLFSIVLDYPQALPALADRLPAERRALVEALHHRLRPWMPPEMLELGPSEEVRFGAVVPGT